MDRIAFWLERFRILRPLLLEFDAVLWNGNRRYFNRINGHVVIITTEGELR